MILQSLPTYNANSTPKEFQAVAVHRTNLSKVSRLWRNVTLGTPKIWSDIVLCLEQPRTVASLAAQLKRSGNAPLNIVITNWPHKQGTSLQSWLDVLVSSANRWQCLHILTVSTLIRPKIFHALEGFEFPSLREVTIDMYGWSAYPRFLLPDQAPALKSLKLAHFVPTPEFAAAMTLTTLDLKVIQRLPDHTCRFPTFVPTESLTVLSLAGDTTGWAFLPDSIHLPRLGVLKLAVTNPRPVLEAIVAPKLFNFDYSPRLLSKPVDFGTGSKFNHVQRLTFDVPCPNVEGVEALCREFCGVRHNRSRQTIGQAWKV
ncbi:hypothetical protein EDC04DRAFT_2693628 [Pisolithus marmoratus]|nr:hypothetical protein EDC04DRAFT_2693628 [Pisolithus marmoratus]